MKKNIIILIKFILIISSVTFLSLLSTKIWNEKPEKLPDDIKIIITPEMTIHDYGIKNNLKKTLLKKIFKDSDLNTKIDDLNININNIKELTIKYLALHAETESKNWIKIPVKFLLWIMMLIIIFYLTQKKSITNKKRKILYIISIVIFGIILGADPSPMGTVKDAVALYGSKKAIFLPRMIAFLAFISIVIIANKYICAWGCQFGTLQDLIFRINRAPEGKKNSKSQIKIPFYISNSVRIIFFIIFASIAFISSIDIFEHFDPFKIFKPLTLTITGISVISMLLVMSLFIYRPWCHFFCPFGLFSWLAEKISIFKIKVNYEKCIACTLCEKACPSTVMQAILRREKILPDCFACNSCIEICPTGSISLAKGKRELPPDGKFTKIKQAK